MRSVRQSPLPEPGFDLEAPGACLYGGEASTLGYRLNRFALSLKSSANRKTFLADEDAYVQAFALSPVERGLVRTRDWSGLMQAGAHLQAVLKLAATLGLDLYDVGAHNVGTDRETLYAACPRRVAGVPGEG